MKNLLTKLRLCENETEAKKAIDLHYFDNVIIGTGQNFIDNIDMRLDPSKMYEIKIKEIKEVNKNIKQAI